MIAAAPDAFVGHFLDAWTVVPGAIPADVRTSYLRTARTSAAIHAICQDYRASAFVDADHDQTAMPAGGCPCRSWRCGRNPGDVALPFDPEKVWAGHFLPEERPAEVAAAVGDLIAPPGST